MVLSSGSFFPPIIRHDTLSLWIFLILCFKAPIVAVWKSGMSTSFSPSFQTCFTKSFSINTSGLNSRVIWPSSFGFGPNKSLGVGLFSSETLKYLSLPGAQEDPSINSGLWKRSRLASTSHTPRYISPNVMSTSAATDKEKINNIHFSLPYYQE